MKPVFLVLFLVAIGSWRAMGIPLSESEGMRLTLSGALELAESRNPDLLASRQRVEVARAGISIAAQRPNPSLGYSYPIGPADRKQKLTFDVPLETGGRRQARLTVAEDGVKEAELNWSQSKLTILNQTRNAFVELAIAKAALEQSRLDLEFYDRLVEAATRRFEAGDIAEADVIRGVFEREQSKRLLYPAENRVEAAMLTLNRLLGQPLDTKLEVIDDGRLFPTEASIDGSSWELPELPALQSLAREHRPDLALAVQQLNTARHRVELARANQSPDLSLQASLLYDPIYPAFTYQAGIQVELPWGSDRSGEVQQARSLEQEALLRHQAALVAAEQSVALAWTNFQNARRQMSHDLQVLGPKAERVLELAQKTYELGLGDITDVLLAGQSVQRQRQAFLTDVALFHRALGELELAVNMRFTGDNP